MGYLNELNIFASTLSNNIIGDRKPQKSMAKGALDGTLQFPCLVSDSISVGMATTLVRTLEQVYASFVQTVISLNSTIDISVDKRPTEFLKKFHKNITALESQMDKREFDEFETFMEMVHDGAHKVYFNEKQNMLVAFDVTDNVTRKMLEHNKVMLESMLDFVDVTPLPNVGNSVFYESDDTIPTKSDLLDNELRRRASSSITRATTLGNAVNLSPQNLPDVQVRKINDMKPFAMQVRLMAVNGEKEFVQFMDFVIGIKVVLHSMKSEEVIYNTKAAIENTGKFFNFLRWTTGEKSLFKDLILNLNNVKLDVANKTKGSSPWWLTLKRMKETSKLQEVLFMRNQVVPNATMILGTFEVDQIQKLYGYDLHDPSVAKKLMRSLFLMNFIIVDDATRLVKVLYDYAGSFQSYSLDAFEMEVQATSNKLSKELARMMSR